MKINSKILNIPPFISTSWDNIGSLHMKGSVLVLVLNNGETVQVPGLAPSTVELIFAAHAASLEQIQQQPQNMQQGNLFMQALTSEEGGEFPFKFGFAANGMASMLQHDPAQRNAPPIPEEILHKISAIAKIVSGDEASSLPKAQSGCNCMHCQICRAISGEKELPEEPTVLEEELRFKDWEIVQTGDQLYEVTNPLDQNQTFKVFLGEPVGCTCGKTGCEHILAVLKS